VGCPVPGELGRGLRPPPWVAAQGITRVARARLFTKCRPCISAVPYARLLANCVSQRMTVCPHMAVRSLAAWSHSSLVYVK